MVARADEHVLLKYLHPQVEVIFELFVLSAPVRRRTYREAWGFLPEIANMETGRSGELSPLLSLGLLLYWLFRDRELQFTLHTIEPIQDYSHAITDGVCMS